MKESQNKTSKMKRVIVVVSLIDVEMEIIIATKHLSQGKNLTLISNSPWTHHGTHLHHCKHK